MSSLAPSVHERLSDTEIEALAAGIRDISSKQKLLARPALQSLLNFINKRSTSHQLPLPDSCVSGFLAFS
jgi:hypothetical protein